MRTMHYQLYLITFEPVSRTVSRLRLVLTDILITAFNHAISATYSFAGVFRGHHVQFNTSFYGRGLGWHSVSVFRSGRFQFSPYTHH
jgi:hypothetical protein